MNERQLKGPHGNINLRMVQVILVLETVSVNSAVEKSPKLTAVE